MAHRTRSGTASRQAPLTPLARGLKEIEKLAIRQIAMIEGLQHSSLYPPPSPILPSGVQTGVEMDCDVDIETSTNGRGDEAIAVSWRVTLAHPLATDAAPLKMERYVDDRRV